MSEDNPFKDAAFRRRRLIEMQGERLPHLSTSDIIEMKNGNSLSIDETLALDEYFSAFMPWPTNDTGKYICPCCRRQVASGVLGIFLAGAPDVTSIVWSLAHGEAHCDWCGWTFRQLHYNVGVNGAEPVIKSLTLCLPYHPDSIAVPEEV